MSPPDQRPGETAHDLFERLRVLVVAGVPVGVVVAGVGGRLAMLVLRLTSPDHVVGVTSDDGFTIGRFTLGGTYNLLMIGALVGLIGAGAYRAVAPWLLGPAWLRRLATAAGSGAVVGAMLVHSDGVDFTVLEPAWLAIGLFVALPALFGGLIGAAVDRVAQPASWTRSGRRRWILPVVLVACFPLTAVAVVVAAFLLAVMVLVRRAPGARAPHPLIVSSVVRGLWLAIALVGLAALISDITAIT